MSLAEQEVLYMLVRIGRGLSVLAAVQMVVMTILTKIRNRK